LCFQSLQGQSAMHVYMSFPPAKAEAAIVIPRRYYDNPDPENTPTRNAAALFASFYPGKSAQDSTWTSLPATSWQQTRYQVTRPLFIPCATRRGTLNISDFAYLQDFVKIRRDLVLAPMMGLPLAGWKRFSGTTILHASVPQGDEWAVKVPGLEQPLSGLVA